MNADEICPHGLKTDENALPDEKGAYTYCLSCMIDALYSGQLGIDMGIHPDITRKLRNKKLYIT